MAAARTCGGACLCVSGCAGVRGRACGSVPLYPPVDLALRGGWQAVKVGAPGNAEYDLVPPACPHLCHNLFGHGRRQPLGASFCCCSAPWFAALLVIRSDTGAAL